MTCSIKRITSTELAKTAKDAWKEQYQFGDGTWAKGGLRDGFAVYQALIALGDSPTPEQVVSVIGNRSWTDVKCDSCGELVEEVIEFSGDPENWEEPSAFWVCSSCLSAGAKILSKSGDCP